MTITNEARGATLTAKIIAAARQVYKNLGAGLREDVYKIALFTELENLGLAVQRQAQGRNGPDANPLDLLVENRVAVRIKARPRLIPQDEIAQVSRYLAAAQKPVGLLFNFGRNSLYFKQILPPRRAD